MQVQDLLLSMGKNCCLAMDYIYSTLTPEIKKDEYARDCALVAATMAAWKAKLLDDEMFVKDANKLLKFFTGKDYCVEKVDIETFKDLPLTAKACVRFDKGDKSHWVYAEKQKIVFDTMAKSQCRFYGKPTTARIIKEVIKEENNNENNVDGK